MVGPNHDTTDAGWDFVGDVCVADTSNGVSPIVDMGAYEFVRSDIARDGAVDLVDLSLLAAHWGDVGCGDCEGADLTCDGDVDIDDLAVFAESWLAGVE